MRRWDRFTTPVRHLFAMIVVASALATTVPAPDPAGSAAPADVDTRAAADGGVVVPPPPAGVTARRPRVDATPSPSTSPSAPAARAVPLAASEEGPTPPRPSRAAAPPADPPRRQAAPAASREEVPPLEPEQAARAAAARRPSESDVPAVVEGFPGGRQRVRLLVRAAGVTPGDRTDARDLRRAARKLGVPDDEPLDKAFLHRLVDAHRRHAAKDLHGAGLPAGNVADDRDVRKGARRLGVAVGPTLDAADVERVRRRARREAARTPVLAHVDGVELRVPSHHSRLVGFHEASYGIARQMVARKSSDATTLPSRGRPTGNRTAADVAVPRRTPVLSPVTGRVVTVERYALYGRYPDAKIFIVPDGQPRRIVKVLHVSGVRVRPGDRVEAGHTPIARMATVFPFRSQIEYVAGRLPHVHIEVQVR